MNVTAIITPTQGSLLLLSIGLAGSVADKLGWNGLMKLQNQALYSVKHSSRNGVQLATFYWMGAALGPIGY